MQFLVKSASSVKSSYRWDLHTVKGTGKMSGVGKNQVDLDLVTTANHMGMATTHGETTIL
jgi:hypothetical protein